MMNIVILNTSDKPIYMQLFDQISAQIIKGEIEQDFCLPAIRTIAKELRISVITVKKAWEELERKGFIYTIAGKGCFVAPLPPGERHGKRNEIIYQKMSKDIAYYKELGLSLDELIDITKRCYKG